VASADQLVSARPSLRAHPPSAGVRPRPRGLGRRPLREQALGGGVDLARYAPSARRRPAFGRGHTPLPIWDRDDSGPLAVFSSLCSVGMAGRPIPPHSSRRNAPRGPISSRSRILRCAPIPWGLVQSFNARGRRGGCAAPASVSPGLCCGPRYAAIWRAQARTSSRRLAALATRPSATAARRLWVPGGGRKPGGGRVENSKFEIPRGGRATFLIPNS